MNRFTNVQRLKIIEFYYQNACSVKKVHRALLPLYGQFRRPIEAAIRAIVNIVRTKFKNSQFGAVYGRVASFCRTSSKMLRIVT